MNVKRYDCVTHFDCGGMDESETGDYVEYDNYASLELIKNELLKELQRLRNYVTDVCGVNDEDCHPEHPLMSSKAAIAKALGESK